MVTLKDILGLLDKAEEQYKTDENLDKLIKSLQDAKECKELFPDEKF